jgi:DNA repair protein RadC
MDKKELIRQLMVAERESPTTAIKQPKDIVPKLMKHASKRQENFYVVLLDGAHNLIAIKKITTGLVNRTIVHPREVFRPAIQKNAVAAIVAHNHPSGNLEPSMEDVEVTERLKKAGEIIGIRVLDHIIVSKNGFYSFLEGGKL